MSANLKNNCFKETLPSGCPPENAAPPSKMQALRFIAALQPTDEDFKSHAELKKPVLSGVDPCRWSSCSFFKFPTIAKLPGVKGKKYIAILEIDQNSGEHQIGKNGHIDLWIYAAFEPIKAIKEIREINNV